jgi:hypothetical protein
MLATLQDAQTLLNVSGDDAQWSGCLAAASAAIEAYCKRSFDLTTRTGYLDGSGTAELVLPSTWLPLNSVTEVRLDTRGGRGQVPDSFDSGTVLTVGVDYIVNTATGTLERYYNGTASGGFGWLTFGSRGPTTYWAGLSSGGATRPYWPRIPGSVKLTASTGYATPPDDLVLACSQLAAHLKRTAKWGGLLPGSQSVIDVSVSLQQQASEAIGNGTSLPAIGSLRQLLSRYVEVAI